MTEEIKERAVKRQRTETKSASDVTDDTISALAQALGQTRLALTRRLPVALWQHKIMPLLTVSENADAQQRGFLVLPVAMSHQTMMKPTEWHIDVPVTSEVLEFWLRSHLLDNVTKLRGSPGKISSANLLRMLEVAGGRLRAISLNLQHDTKMATVLHSLPETMEEVSFSTGGYIFPDATDAVDMGKWFARMSRLQTLRLCESLWSPRSDEEHKLMFANLPESLVTLDSVYRNLPSVDMLRLLLQRCPRLVNWTIGSARHLVKSPTQGTLAAALKGDSRPWRSFSWTTVGYTNLSWADFAPFANDQLVSINVGMISDGNVDHIEKFLGKCPQLQVFRHKFDWDVADLAKVMMQKLEVIMKSPCRATLTDIGNQWPFWHDFADGVLARLYRALPRLAGFSDHRVWKHLKQDMTDVLLLAERKDSLRSVYTHDSTCETSAETWFKIIKSSTAWTSISLNMLLDGGKTIESSRVLTYLASHCPNLEVLNLAHMCNEVDGPSLSQLIATMRRRSILQIGTSFSLSPRTDSPTVRLEHLGTRSTRPSCVDLTKTVLSSLTGDDIATLGNDKSGPRGSLHFFVSFAAARDFLASGKPTAAKVNITKRNGTDGFFDFVTTVEGLGQDPSACFHVSIN